MTCFWHIVMQIGGLCRAMTIQDVARRMHLDWHTVKELDKIYMHEQLRVAGSPKPNVIGMDEISIKNRHIYRIVVSDLESKRPIWFGSTKFAIQKGILHEHSKPFRQQETRHWLRTPLAASRQPPL